MKGLIKKYKKEGVAYIAFPTVQVLNRGTLSLTSPRRGSKLLQDKSQEPTGSDYPVFRPVLWEKESKIYCILFYYAILFKTSYKIRGYEKSKY